MTEPTDEMIRAFSDADFSGCGNADWEDSHVRIGLAAVLAIVERDYDVRKALCMQSNPQDWGALCELWRGHDGQHRARISQEVTWGGAP